MGCQVCCLEAPHPLEVEKQLTPLAVLGDHVQLLSRLDMCGARLAVRNDCGLVGKVRFRAKFGTGVTWNANINEITKGWVILAIILRSALVCSI